MTSIELTADTPLVTERLAAELSSFARPGQVVLLRGELGAGKSVFARAFIRALAGPGQPFEIPSPSFTLIQIYNETRVPAAHIDLYRLTSPAETAELGLEDLIKTHVLLIEWPERIDDVLSDDVLSITMAGSGNSRTLSLRGEGSWATALARNDAIRAFLSTTSWKDAPRTFLEGDASFRRYEVLEQGRAPRAILMDMPAKPDGPPVKDGKSYSAIAHLAEDIRAVIAVNRHLTKMGYSAPEILAADISAGFAVIEDLGDRVYGRMRNAGEDMREPMRSAVALLADMARNDWPAVVPVGAGVNHTVPSYDREAQLIEVDLLPSWFWPYLHGIEVPDTERAAFAECWTACLPAAIAEKPVWALRDFHSPNLLWLPQRPGIRSVGIIDTQDCLLGHPAYDLASLLQDARVDIPPEEEAALFDHYCSLRASDAAFDRKSFAAAYAILGAQRATKILGIFARLSKRDGKHGYLQHLPRVSRYLERNLQHPALQTVRRWYDRHLPPHVREARR